ncbi:MAG: hypothetical protein IPL39_03380 [Opitutaceae bacterium]|nr:hypothetical protein [Opitutaceae bacterium]
MNNRRHFLRSIVIVGAALTARPLASWARAGSAGASAADATAGASKDDPMSHAAFAAVLGTGFVLADGSRLVLEKVSELARCPHTESFSLWLQRETGPDLVAGTQVFEHATLGRFEMFVVPKTRADGGQGCEAVFNRLVA